MIQNKLKEVCEFLKMRFPISQISKDLDYSKGTISEYYNDKKELSENFKEHFERFYEINFEHFFKKDVVNEPKSVYKKENSGVPYYDVDFTSSFLEVENDQTITPTSYINHPFFFGCDLVVRNSGQSMAKVICHGDAIGLIKLENWREFFPYGEIYAIVTFDNHRMIKVITEGETKDTFTLISKPTDNKKDEFPNQQIKKSSILQIFKVQASSHLF